MPTLPPIPSWEGAHVLVVHLPIGLLLIAPLLVIAGIFPGRWREGLRLAALLLLVAGTAGAYVARESGEAAAQVADRTPQVSEVLEQHEELATQTCIVFTIATAFYAAFLILTLAVQRSRSVKVSLPLQVLSLAILFYGALVLADTGHMGGRLVHELGVRAMVQ